MSRRTLLSVGTVASLTLFLFVQARTKAWQRPAVLPDSSQATEIVRLEFGIEGSQARQWTGEVSSDNGEILSLDGWHFLQPDRVIGTRGFEFATRKYAGEAGDVYREPASDLPVAVLPNGILLTLRGGPGTAVNVHSNHGDFRFQVAELKTAGRLAYLNGDVNAVYSPAVKSLTEGAASQHDFPAVAARGEQVFAAWVTYQNEANLVYFAARKDGAWKVEPASPLWGDYYQSAVAVDGAGRAHVVWGEYKDDRWRLVARAYDAVAEKWAAPEYIAPAGRRQMFPRLTTESAGAVWAAWQEFDGVGLKVFAARRGVRG